MNDILSILASEVINKKSERILKLSEMTLDQLYRIDNLSEYINETPNKP